MGLGRYREHDIRRAARRVVRQLTQSGPLPQTFDGWRRLCASFGVECVPVMRAPWHFCARLIQQPRGQWTIFYNPYMGDRARARFLCHELAEFISLADARPFAGLPGTPQLLYTGGDCRDDVHHRIARRVEDVCFRRTP